MEMLRGFYALSPFFSHDRDSSPGGGAKAGRGCGSLDPLALPLGELSAKPTERGMLVSGQWTVDSCCR